LLAAVAILATKSRSEFFEPFIADTFGKGTVTFDKGASAVSTSPRSQVAPRGHTPAPHVFLDRIAAADRPNRKLEGPSIHIIFGAVVRRFCEVVQAIHLRMQNMNSFAATFARVDRNLAIEPAGGPLLIYSVGQLRSVSVPIGMKDDASALSAEGFVAVTLIFFC
jgi:hypothetical protein